jgi:thiol-disulfide isomerase/thioredoxin
MSRARLVVLIALLPFACDKQGTNASPPEGVLAAHDPPPAEDTVASEPPAEEASTAGGDEASAPADTVAAVPEPSTAEPSSDPVAPPSGAPGETEPAAKRELPKALHGKIDKSCGNDEGVGQKLKSFALSTVDGKPVSNKSWKGRVLLVNFWGTWCKPCLKELPEFEQLYRRYKKHGLTLVAIATDEDPAPVKEYVESRKISAKVVIGAEDYAGQYGSTKFPFSFVVDTKGVIRASFRGYRPECIGKVEAELRRELEARAAAG